MKHIVFDCDGTLVDTSLPRYKLFPGIKNLLSELSTHSTLYVWTARGRASTLRMFQELEILQYFEGISTPDDAPPKPHIGGLIELIGSFSKKSICVIGDSSNDMIGAKNFGITGIGAVWNLESKDEVLKDYGADFIVYEPQECSKLIQQILIED